MTTPAAPEATLTASTLFQDLDLEFALTRRLLERFPDAHADWRPHEKSTPLGQLAAHVAQLPHFGVEVAEAPEFDFAKTSFSLPKARTAAELVALFDDRSAKARQAILGLDAAALAATWTLRAGELVFASGSRSMMIRQLMINHTAHHRGQLTVYYRLLGVPVPSIYGPTADEQAMPRKVG